MDELTIADLDGRRTEVKLGRRAARSKNRPFKVSLRCRSTALCVARLSAVLALREVLRFSAALAGALGLLLFALLALGFVVDWSPLPVELAVWGGGG
jgi:hypothetical protein